VHTYIVRVWLPDRPGALGAVASRIGAARGDVVGIEILEQGAGRAIDELVVHLPDPDLVDLLVREISQVDGVDVEEVRPTSERLYDPRFEALEMAASLIGETDPTAVLDALCRSAARTIEADWAAVVTPEDEAILASSGVHPTAAWLHAYVHGSGTTGEADDVVSAALEQAGLVLVLGRDRAAFRERQRRHVVLLTQIGDTRLAELAGRAPSA
jgi:ACT domain